MTHKTKGIILRTVKYGETSIIATVYTELFGIQSYIVKGVRQLSKHGSTKANYFQPAAILEMEVYHNELKNLQFIRDYQWNVLYEHVFFNVVKNAAAMYIVELLLRSLKQPEPNPDLFYLAEESLKQLDKSNDTLTANVPLFFTLQLATEAGFGILGEYSEKTPVLDLQEGIFVADIPTRPYFITGDLAQKTSQINKTTGFDALANFQLNRITRRSLLLAYRDFLSLHIEDFGELKTLDVLEEILK
jgi:DNA repair protein RecO (recombination protein O)